MSNIFLDCGTNFGQGLKQHIQIYGIDENWIIHSFEACYDTYKIAKKVIETNFPKLNITLHNKAVWSENTTRYLITEGQFTDQVTFMLNQHGLIYDDSVVDFEKLGVGGASNILQDNYNFGVAPPETEKRQDLLTECIDLSEFILTNFTKDDNILLKLDVEGAEYEIINKLLTTGATKYIRELVVEWHFNLVSNQHDARNLTIRLLQEGVSVKNWY